MNTVSFYIIVSAAFVATMLGRQSPINKGKYFGYGVTLDSTYVISINTANDFVGALDTFASTLPDSALQVLALTPNDFPKSPKIQ